MSTTARQIAYLQSLVLPLSRARWSPQQDPIIRHLPRLSTHLADLIAPIPAGDYAEGELIPALAESLRQPLIALMGYARLLLSHPVAFAGALVPDEAVAQVQELATAAQMLLLWLDELETTRSAERQQARQAPCDWLDMAGLLEAEYAIWCYLLRDSAVRIKLDVPSDLPHVWGQAYHLRAGLRHIVLTMARELIAYGWVQVRAYLAADRVEVNVFCTGIQLDRAQWGMLFEREGRALIHRHLAKMADVASRREPGRGSSLVLKLATPTSRAWLAGPSHEG